MLVVHDATSTHKGRVQPKGEEVKHVHHDGQGNPLELKEWLLVRRIMQGYESACVAFKRPSGRRLDNFVFPGHGNRAKSLQALVVRTLSEQPRRTLMCGLSWRQQPSTRIG